MVSRMSTCDLFRLSGVEPVSELAISVRGFECHNQTSSNIKIQLCDSVTDVDARYYFLNPWLSVIMFVMRWVEV